MDRAAWLEARKPNIGASEIAAVLGVSPWETRYGIWARKKGLLPESDDNRFMEWGRRLEAVVADWVAERTGWTLKTSEYRLHPKIRGMACSLDREIADWPGILEIKTCDAAAFRHWPDGEPPLTYQLQIQHQLAVTGWERGALAVLVGGNDPRLFEFERHPGAIARIEAAVVDFWTSIDENRPPPPDWMADTATVIALHQRVETGLAVAIDDDATATLCALYDFAGANARKWEEAQKEAKARVLQRIGAAEKAIINSANGNTFRVSAKQVAPAEIKAYTRAAYRGFRIKEERAAGAAPMAMGAEAFKQLETLALPAASEEE